MGFSGPLIYQRKYAYTGSTRDGHSIFELLDAHSIFCFDRMIRCFMFMCSDFGCC